MTATQPAATPDITFIIPVRDDRAALERCLLSLRATAIAGVAIEVIVVDNGSRDGSGATARALGARVIDAPGVRVSAMRNIGAASARGAILGFVDADHEVVEAWGARVVEIFSDRSVWAAGAAYQPPPRGTWTQRMFGALRGPTVGRGDVGWLGSGNLAVRREAFERVGGFDEALETCEDVDFCQKLRAAGGRVIGDERLRSVHFGDPKTLRELFEGERWRGRDNLRVSFRAPAFSWRDVPSVVIPVADAAALVLLPVSAVAVPIWPGPATASAVAAAAVILVFAAARAARMLAGHGGGVTAAAQAFAVALTYDLGRATALVFPARHRRAAAR